MFFFFSKVLLIFLSPFFWLLIALSIHFFWKSPVYKKRAKIAAMSILLFFSNTFIFNQFCRMWEIPGTRIQHLKTYEIGIVLSGAAEYNNDLQLLSIRRSGDRVWQAITLYKKGKIKKILLTGDSGYLSDKGLHESAQMKDVLVAWGIPSKDIVVECTSRNTYENARETKKILTTSFPHIDSCLLITSGTHMKRASACFDKQGILHDTYSTDLYTGPTDTFFWDQLLVPSVDTFVDWKFLIKEWFGYVAYKMTGYC
ncbi:MAG: YdcF family protein [Crocinitomicaceae bacterium]|nr:MAG: YdcF family protein [Crocinitomicaceae bacterium]